MRKGIYRWEREYEDEKGNMKMRKGIWRWEREYEDEKGNMQRKGLIKKFPVFARPLASLAILEAKFPTLTLADIFQKLRIYVDL